MVKQVLKRLKRRRIEIEPVPSRGKGFSAGSDHRK